MADAGRTDVLGPLVHAKDVQAAWDGLGTDRRRAVIDALVTVVIMPAGQGAKKFREETVVVTQRR